MGCGAASSTSRVVEFKRSVLPPPVPGVCTPLQGKTCKKTLYYRNMLADTGIINYHCLVCVPMAWSISGAKGILSHFLRRGSLCGCLSQVKFCEPLGITDLTRRICSHLCCSPTHNNVYGQCPLSGLDRLGIPSSMYRYGCDSV